MLPDTPLVLPTYRMSFASFLNKLGSSVCFQRLRQPVAPLSACRALLSAWACASAGEASFHFVISVT